MNLFVKKKITSLETLTLRLTGMRYCVEYEITGRTDGAELSLYVPLFDGGEKKRQLKKRTVVPNADVLELLDRCGLAGWNGFVGKHPRGVLDGTMFSLTAFVNGGQKITADGSQNFPRHFDLLRNALYEWFRDVPEREEETE